jgi:dihydroorotase/N-acyl-D-amino-acid deacylase
MSHVPQYRRGRSGIGGALAIVFLALAVHLTGQAPAHDIVIQGGRVVDGTGSPWFIADVGIKGDTIVAVSAHLTGTGARTIQASGLVVAPGFIDVHSHSEAATGGIVGVPLAENNVRQGVTTVFGNPDGGGDVSIKAFLDKVSAARPTINVGAFIGQGAVRAKVIGLVNRTATAAELEEMRGLVRKGMEDGAFGLSTGLFYVPGVFTPLQEIIELAREVALYGGIHQSHMRDEAAGVLDSVRETIAIGENGGLPTQVTHHKIVGKENWGKSVQTLELIDEARRRGVDVTIDQYPYTASSTNLQSGLLPAWVGEGGREQVLKRLADPMTRTKIRGEVVRIIREERGGGDPRNVVLASCSWDRSLDGKNLADVAQLRGSGLGLDGAAEAAMWIVEQGNCGAVFHAINEDDLTRIMKHPVTMIASDAAPGEPEFGVGAPHPRAYGTFARMLGLYVRERRILTLEEAVRKMSAYPAQRMSLTDRGIVRPGMKADLVVFDSDRVRDAATFEKPHQYAEGFVHVIVNGEIVLQDGAITSARPGRVLYGPGVAKRGTTK